MKKVKIAIIAHSCRVGGGLVGTVNILRALKNVAEREEFMVTCPAGCGYEEIKMPPGSELFVYEGSHSPLERYWFEKVRLPKIVDNYDPDVIFGPGNIGLTRPCAPQAEFIRQGWLFYDKKHYPDMSLWLKIRLAQLRSQVKKSLLSTNLIFCQTSVVKQRFSEKYRYPENQMKILRFPPPVETTARPDTEVPSVFDKSSGNFFVILLTRYLPHRNPGILIHLCQRYGPQIRAEKIKFITTVEERDDRQAGVFLKDICRYHLEDIIINIGRLRREDISKYLFASDVLWLPTLVETLCLPYLEAMSLGVPIVAPDLDFARYVCGQAAIFYDPWNIESVFKTLMLIREDALLRQELAEKGKLVLSNPEKFSANWEEVASDTLEALRGISRGNS